MNVLRGLIVSMALVTLNISDAESGIMLRIGPGFKLPMWQDLISPPKGKTPFLIYALDNADIFSVLLEAAKIQNQKPKIEVEPERFLEDWMYFTKNLR